MTQPTLLEQIQAQHAQLRAELTALRRQQRVTEATIERTETELTACRRYIEVFSEAAK